MNRLPDELLCTPSTTNVTSWYKMSFEEMMEYRNTNVTSAVIDKYVIFMLQL